MTSTPIQNITRFGNRRIALGLAGLATACALVATAPVAATPTATVSARVSYADLKLTDATGQAALDSRLRGAARRICDVRASAGSALATMEARRCYRPAIADARAKAGSATRMALLLVRDRNRGAT